MLEASQTQSPHLPGSIVLVDDHQVVRDGLCFVIRAAMNFHNVVGLESLKELRTYITLQGQAIDCVVIDLELSDATGTAAVREAKQLLPDVPIFVYTGSTDAALKRQCIQIGAREVVDKTMHTDTLLDSLREVVSERSTKATGSSVNGLTTALDTLSPRQREVLQCLKEGMSNQETAHNLGIAVPTVKVHISGIYKALGVNSRAAAIKLIK